MARHDAQENMRKQAAERVRRVVLPDTPLSSRAKSENGAPRQNMPPRPSNAEAERSERRTRELPTQERSTTSPRRLSFTFRRSRFNSTSFHVRSTT